MEKIRGIQKLLTGAGCVLLLYLLFRFVFPLIFPFILAFIVALLIRPAVCALRQNLHLKEGAGAVLVLLLCAAGAGIVLYYGGGILIGQMKGFLGQLQEHPIWKLFTNHTSAAEAAKICPDFVAVGIRKAGEHFTFDRCIAWCMKYSGHLAGWCGSFFTSCFVFFIAAILAVEEMESLRQRASQWVFYREMVDFGTYLCRICGKWVRVQGIIWLLTTAISIAGLWAGGFSYAVLIGTIVGIVDLLPIFGSGTIYIPWLIWEFLNKRSVRGIILLFLYLICYFLREFLESRIMGKYMGITSFEFLLSVYVGMKLFGVSGFLLGPLSAFILQWILQRNQAGGEEKKGFL